MTAVEHVVQLLRDDPGWDVLALGQARSLLMDLSRESCQDPLLFAALCSQEAVRTEAWLERRRREPQQPPLLWEWPQPRLLDLLFATVAYARAWEDVLKVIDAISVAYKQRVDSPCLSVSANKRGWGGWAGECGCADAAASPSPSRSCLAARRAPWCSGSSSSSDSGSSSRGRPWCWRPSGRHRSRPRSLPRNRGGPCRRP